MKKNLIDKKELGIPYSNVINKGIINAATRTLGINRINKLYGKVSHLKGVECAEAVLNELNCSIKISSDSISQIPKKGGFIVVSNHPHGALDGILLINEIAKVRPDVKFMGNYLLSRVEPLKDFFLLVNPFNSKSGKNISGMRQAITHLEMGGGLIIFPAGEVSTYRKGFRKIEDKDWPLSIARFIQRSKVPVIPLYISGKNSLKFHLLGKIHPILRTARMPLELLNKRNITVNIEIGKEISPRLLSKVKTEKELAVFLKSMVYLLKKRVSNLESRNFAANIPPDASQIVDRESDEILKREIEQLKESGKGVLQKGEFHLFLMDYNDSPTLFREIARQREITFREVGEGTNNELDEDKFDKFYKHLFIWHTGDNQLVGAYRLGFGAELFNNGGIDNFYTNTLFKFKPEMHTMLERSIELGRSFITERYQRQLQSLIMLWQGIFGVLIKNPEYRYLVGPVSISGAYKTEVQWLIMHFLKINHWNSKYADLISPRNGIKVLSKGKFKSQIADELSSVGLLNSAISCIEPLAQGMPILLEKYLNLNGEIASFNVDPDFNNTLDALLIVDLERVPQRAIDMVKREFEEK